MPTNKKERALFALITNIFYSLYVINGKTLMNITESSRVLRDINKFGVVLNIYLYVSLLFS